VTCQSEDSVGRLGMLAEDAPLLEKPFSSSAVFSKVRESLDNKIQAGRRIEAADSVRIIGGVR
jgi:hypothetical protein